MAHCVRDKYVLYGFIQLIDVVTSGQAVACLRSSVVSLPRRRPGFDPRQIWGETKQHWNMGGDKVALEQVFSSKHTGSPCQYHSAFFLIYTLLLPEGQTGDAYEPSHKTALFRLSGSTGYCDFAVHGVTVANVQHSGCLFPTFRRNVMVFFRCGIPVVFIYTARYGLKLSHSTTWFFSFI